MRKLFTSIHWKVPSRSGRLSIFLVGLLVLALVSFGEKAFGATGAANANTAGADANSRVLGVQAISSVTPSSGPVGTLITIAGSNLQGVTAVFIGNTPATGVTADPSGAFVQATVGVGTPQGSNVVTITNNGATETGPAFVVTTPTIVVTPSSLANFNTVQGTPSNAQSYTVRGDGLGNNALIITSPPNFAVALSANGPYSSVGQSLTPNSAGNVPATTVYVRMTGATTGPYSGSIDNSSNGAITQSVSVSGTVFASSFLDASPTQLSGFAAVVGQNSASQTFTVSGNGLSADVTVTAPNGYEVATSNIGPYNSSLLLTRSGQAINQVVYVRLQNSIAAGSYGGGISVISGTNTRNVVLSGVVENPVLASEPSSQGSLTFGVTTNSSINVAVSPGNGTSRILLIRQGGAVDATPQDAFVYQASSVFGSGSEIGTLNFVVLNGNTNSVTVTGLTANTQYFFALYEYNGTGTASNYLTANPFVANATTLSSTPTLAGELLLEEGFDYALNTVLTSTGNWAVLTAGNSAVQTGSTSLDFTQYGTPSTVGTAALLRGSNSSQSVQRRILDAPLTVGDLFVAAQVRINSHNATDYFMALLPEGNDAASRARVYVQRATASTVNIGLSFNGTTISYAQTNGTITNFNTGVTYVVVLRYRRVLGANNDQVRMYVLSSSNVPENEPTNPAVADITAPTGSEVDFTHLALRTYGGSVNAQDVTVDGIRVGTGWGATVGRPRFIDNQFALRAGNYYDVSLGGITSAISVLGGQVTVNNALVLGQGRLLTTATNLLVMASNASASPGTNNSFVDGPMAAVSVGNKTFRYPIGKGGIFRPFTLGITQTGTGTYQVEMFNAPAPLRPLPLNIDRISRVRYYAVERIAQNSSTSSGTASAGQVTLSYGTDDGVNDEANLRVVKSTNGGAYSDLGPPNGGTSSPSGTITADSFAETFAAQVIFTLGNNIPGTNPLPVELVSFNARLQGERGLLTWATANEKNSASFEVQRSLDGVNFKQIGTREAAGNSSSLRQYSFTDNSVPAGTVYYRLRQVDFDGTASLSDIVTLKKAGELALSLYPNPATERLTLQAGAEPIKWQVRNGMGQVLMNGAAEGLATLDVAKLPAGVYYLEAVTGDQRQTQKFVKR